MVQAKSNRELASLGADLTSPDVNEGYITCTKWTISSTVQHTEEINVLSLQEPAHNDNEDVLVDTAN